MPLAFWIQCLNANLKIEFTLVWQHLVHIFSSLPILWLWLLWNGLFFWAGKYITFMYMAAMKGCTFRQNQIGWVMIMSLSNLSIAAQRHFAFWWHFVSGLSVLSTYQLMLLSAAWWLHMCVRLKLSCEFSVTHPIIWKFQIFYLAYLLYCRFVEL